MTSDQAPVTVPDDEAVAMIDAAYRLILCRPADEAGVAHFLPRISSGASTAADVCAELVHSHEFADRLAAPAVSIDAQHALPADAVDVRRLLETLSVEDLSSSADEYYEKNLEAVDYYLSKPLTNSEEAPDLLTAFAQVLATLRPLPGMRVLDFGAGTCWSTRFLTQLGYEAVAVDVSPIALEVGRQLFERLPVVGHRPEPTFLVFDGHRIDLPDESVDHIVCLDAFHHVPNPDEVLAELGRVLRPGGIAGFTEPGPNHSKTAQSQFEMRNYTVIENDIVMADVARWAESAGFSQLRLALFSAEPYNVSVAEYEDFLAGGIAVAALGDHVRRFAEGRRIFFLAKGAPVTADSRDRRGLMAELQVSLDAADVPAGGRWTGTAVVRNAGANLWLPSSPELGGVSLGLHLYDGGGRLLERDFGRIPLPDVGGAGVLPGRALQVPITVDAPPPGSYRLAFDLVSEHVCWFEINGSPTVELPVEVHR